jgi:hypothetical protein
MKSFLNSRRGQSILMIAFGLLIGVGIVYALVSHNAKKADLEGTQTSYTGCQITEKDSRKTVRGRAHEPNYYIMSSCGTFRTSEDIYNRLEVGNYYDWSATAGNWANKPTIKTIESSTL